jgi:hypothetical protein
MNEMLLYLMMGLGLALVFFITEKDISEEEKIKHFGLIVLFFPIMLPYFIYKKFKK